MNRELIESLLNKPEVIESMKGFNFDNLDDEQIDVVLDYLLSNINI
ncbi:hypothetical protein ACRZ5S_23195 (plasmid) [Vibrio scophthalmi]